MRILLEPKPKNTAPALTLAALAAQDTNPDSVLVVTPADHYVKDLNQFTLVMHEAIKAVQGKTIVTLGINPTRPDTGFGYIHFEGEGLVKNVLTFKEKPDLKTAQEMINQGQHAWNGGMFILQSETWLDAIQQCNSDIFNTVQKAWHNKNKDQWFERPDPELFKHTPSDSIDYAVMEHCPGNTRFPIKMLTLDAGWSDIGSWSSLWGISKKDVNGNVTHGDVMLHSANNSYVRTDGKLVAVIGIDDLVIVSTKDALMVSHKNSIQDIKVIPMVVLSKTKKV